MRYGVANRNSNPNPWLRERKAGLVAVKASRITGCRPRSVARRSFAERVKCVLGTWCGDGLGLVVGCWVVLGSLRVGCG